MNYDEFLRGIAGEMNSFRRQYVEKAFAKLDRDRSGIVEVDDIKGVYNA